MTKDQIQSFHQVCRLVIIAGERGLPGQLILYAARYAKAGLQMTSHDAIACQCDYILNNLSGWRGEEAVSAKRVLRELSNA